MDASSEEMFLQNIEEFVLDEDKIVRVLHWNASSAVIYLPVSDHFHTIVCVNHDFPV